MADWLKNGDSPDGAVQFGDWPRIGTQGDP